MPAIVERSQDGLQLYQRLVDGDEQSCRDLLHRLAEDEGASVLRLCEVMTEAFHEIGDAWECSQLEVYREHIASQIGYRILLDLRGHLPSPEQDAPVAIGCTPENDPYVLPTIMVELVLRDGGWRTQSLGSNLPLEMLAPAIRDTQPKLCWVSISSAESPDRLRYQAGSAVRTRRE